jgi:hypothetical protein
VPSSARSRDGRKPTLSNDSRERPNQNTVV